MNFKETYEMIKKYFQTTSQNNLCLIAESNLCYDEKSFYYNGVKRDVANFIFSSGNLPSSKINDIKTLACLTANKTLDTAIKIDLPMQLKIGCCVKVEYKHRPDKSDYITITEYAIFEIEIDRFPTNYRTFMGEKIRSEKDPLNLIKFSLSDPKTSKPVIRNSLMFFEGDTVDIRTNCKKGSGYYPANLRSLFYYPHTSILNTIIQYYYETTGNTMLLDVKREVLNSGGFMRTSIPLSDVLNSHNKKEYFKKKFKYDVPKSINKMDFQLLHAFGCATKFIDEKDVSFLYDYINNKMSAADIKDMYSYNDIWDNRRNRKKDTKSSACGLLSYVLHSKNKMDLNLCYDYVSCAVWVDEKINIRGGKKAVLNAHNQVTYKFYKEFENDIEMKIPNTPLKKLILPKEFERLETSGRMCYESFLQHNCVRTYINKVNEGRCVIYAATINDERVTIEIIYDQHSASYNKEIVEPHFKVAQCYLAYNRRCSMHTLQYVNEVVYKAGKDFFENTKMGQKKMEQFKKDAIGYTAKKYDYNNSN